MGPHAAESRSAGVSVSCHSGPAASDEVVTLVRFGLPVAHRVHSVRASRSSDSRNVCDVPVTDRRTSAQLRPSLSFRHYGERVRQDDFEGGPHTHGVGTAAFVLGCLALAVGAVVGFEGSFKLEEPALLLLFVPVLFACYGAYKAAECDRLRRDWSSKTARDFMWSAKSQMMAVARRAHTQASNWQSAAFVLSIPAAAGTVDVFLK